MLTSFAPAKVNLFLHVTGRRADGYHLLDSLAVFPNVGDTLTAAPADVLALKLGGLFGESLAAEADNLVLRAARRLKPDGVAALTLSKDLPIASGIGGGSADAAAALRVLAKLWGEDAELGAIALALGADIPVCLGRRPARMGGIGEVLAQAPRLPDFGMVLVNPGIGVATPDVFRARQGPFSAPADLPDGWPTAALMAEDLRRLTNDLEPPAMALRPVIGEVLGAIAGLPGCLLARMSGSGATCFGIFASPEAAVHAEDGLGNADWWRWAGGLYEPSPHDL